MSTSESEKFPESRDSGTPPTWEELCARFRELGQEIDEHFAWLRSLDERADGRK
jgi:hypothetical protein